MAKLKKQVTNSPNKPNAIVSPTQNTSNVWLIVSGIIMLLAYTKIVLDPVLITKYLPLSLLLGIATIAAWRSSAREQFFSVFKASYFWAIYAIYLLFSGLSIFNSTLLGEAFFEWSKPFLFLWALALLLFYYKNKDRNTSFRTEISRILSVFSLISCLVALIQGVLLLQEKQINHENLYAISSLFSHRNIFCEVLLLLLPFTIYASIYEKTIIRYIAIVASTLSLVFLIGLLSRSIWIAMFLALLLVGLFYILMEFPNWKKQEKSKQMFGFLGKYIGAFLLLFFVIVFVFSYLDKSNPVQKLIDSITNIQYYSNQDRLQKWQHSLTIFQENPFLGTGLGDWKIDIMAFPTHDTECEYGKLMFQRPHNDYLWVLSETGIVAFLAYLGIFMSILAILYKGIRNTEEEDTRNWLYLMAYGIVAYMVFSTFAFPKERMEDMYLLHLLFAGVLIEYPKRVDFTPSSYSKPLLGVGFLLLLFCMYLGKERFLGEKYMRDFQNAKGQKKTEVAIKAGEKSLRPLYQMDPVSTPVEYLIGSEYLPINKLQIAKEHLDAAYAITPNHVQVLNNLGACYFQLNDKAKAEELYKRAIYLAPKYQDALLSLSVVHLQKRTIAGYWDAFETVCAIDSSSKAPKYASYWSQLADTLASHIQLEEPLLQSEMQKAIKHKSTSLLAFYHSKGSKLPFSVQLMAEVLYSMYVNKAITEEQWANLKKKYNCEISISLNKKTPFKQKK